MNEMTTKDAMEIMAAARAGMKDQRFCHYCKVAYGLLEIHSCWCYSKFWDGISDNDRHAICEIVSIMANEGRLDLEHMEVAGEA